MTFDCSPRMVTQKGGSAEPVDEDADNDRDPFTLRARYLGEMIRPSSRRLALSAGGLSLGVAQAAPWRVSLDDLPFVVELLRMLFSELSLIRFLYGLPDGYRIAEHLCSIDVPFDFMCAATSLLRQAGMLDHALLDVLARRFPQHLDEVEEVRTLFPAG